MKITIRNIWRQKGYSFINIAGLAIGIACFVLILLFIQDELSYDSYHEKADRIYRLERQGFFNGQDYRTFITAHPTAPAIVADYPEVEAGVRIWDVDLNVRNWNNQFIEETIFFTDQELFDVFDFGLTSGDRLSALTEPNSIVITESMANKYFNGIDVIGKPLKVQWEDSEIVFNVTGILKPMPANSHFHAEFLASYSTLRPLMGERLDVWVSNSISTYLMLRPEADPEQLTAKFPDMVTKYMGDVVRSLLGPEADVTSIFQFTLRPLTEIHLHSDLQFEIEPSGSIATVITFTAIALFMILIAVINFMNLATARSARRAREVGIRKVVGANRKQLIGQFLGESLILTYFAALVALLIVWLTLPSFNAFTLKELSIGWSSNLYFYPGLFLLATVVGFLSGTYPAFFLSSYRPVKVLKGGTVSVRGRRTSRLRQGLVILQFAISIALIFSTLAVSRQLSYFQKKDLGFNKERVVVIPIRDNTIQDRIETVKSELLKQPQVISAGASSRVPGSHGFSDTVFRGEGSPEGDMVVITIITVDQDFLPGLEVDILAGRNFSREFPSDWEDAVIINELAAEKLGWKSADEAVGKIIYSIEEVDPPTYSEKKVVGVTSSFHIKSLHHDLEPLLMHTGHVYGNLEFLSVRISGDDISGTLAFMKEKWAEFSPGFPFDYFFLDENFENQYAAEIRMRTIFQYFTILTIFIACLGLLGLASFATEQRTKEIGIRKTLGASVTGITALLGREFVILVLLANLIALPTGHYLISRWLENFAYQADIGAAIYFAAALIALVIAVLTVSFQAVKAANANPVNALKYE